ncbi:MAG: copper ion binding protein, partial [Burkholderiales bacterium]|nr:copper ion binding protein [Burkholderiales bacterium]
MSDASLTLPIEGMSCATCALRVERALRAVPGVHQVQVNLATDSAAVEAAPSVAAGTLQRAVEQAGYAVPREQVALAIDGMSCASCVGRVEKALAAVPGVVEASVNLATAQATVTR